MVREGNARPVQAIIDNARDGFTAEQIATEVFEQRAGKSISAVRC
jgi:hypothetical protein